MTGLPQGAGAGNGAGLPAGAKQAATDFGVPGYGGPCPPKGDKPHHYNFTVYAVKVEKLATSAPRHRLGRRVHDQRQFPGQGQPDRDLWALSGAATNLPVLLRTG